MIPAAPKKSSASGSYRSFTIPVKKGNDPHQRPVQTSATPANRTNIPQQQAVQAPMVPAPVPDQNTSVAPSITYTSEKPQGKKPPAQKKMYIEAAVKDDGRGIHSKRFLTPYRYKNSTSNIVCIENHLRKKYRHMGKLYNI